MQKQHLVPNNPEPVTPREIKKKIRFKLSPWVSLWAAGCEIEVEVEIEKTQLPKK